MAALVHVTHWQVSAGQSSHTYDHGRIFSSPIPLSAGAAFVEPLCPNKRPSVELKSSSSGANILDAVVADSAGRTLYTVTSDDGRTKLRSQRDNSKVATIDWDYRSPRMVFCGKKVKCKEWLSHPGLDTEYVLMLMTRASLL